MGAYRRVGRPPAAISPRDSPVQSRMRRIKYGVPGSPTTCRCPAAVHCSVFWVPPACPHAGAFPCHERPTAARPSRPCFHGPFGFAQDFQLEAHATKSFRPQQIAGEMTERASKQGEANQTTDHPAPKSCRKRAKTLGRFAIP